MARQLFNEIAQYGPQGTEWCDIKMKQELSKITDKIDDKYYADFFSGHRREGFVYKYAWGTPDENAILKIKKFVDNETILEVGSGNGLWAFLLKEYNVHVIATDDFSDYTSPKDLKTYTTVENIDCKEAIKKYSNAKVLMICWGRTNPTPYFQGDKIIYIGELCGCTAGTPDKKNWKLVKSVDIPRWFITKDRMYLYSRITI